MQLFLIIYQQYKISTSIMQLFLIIYQHQSMQLFPNIVQYQLMQLFFNIKKFQHQHKQLFLIFYQYQRNYFSTFINIIFFNTNTNNYFSSFTNINENNYHHLVASTYTITSPYLFNIKKFNWTQASNYFSILLHIIF